MESDRSDLLQNPREGANIFSQLFFLWTIPLFQKGYSKVLQLTDIYQPLKGDKSKTLGDRLETNWKKQQYRETQRPSLQLAIGVTFWKEYFVFSSLFFVNDVILRLGQPILLGKLLMYFREENAANYSDAIAYATGLVVLNVMNAVLVSQLVIIGYHNGMKVRVAVCSVIYRKALRLSQTALGETSAGKIVNLLSNDVKRFDSVNQFLNAMWVAPLLTIIIGCLLWNEIRWAGLVGIAVIFIVVPIQSYLGKLTSKYRSQTASRTDERIRFVDEIITGIQIIKMYAWELPFTQLITAARKMELKFIRKTSYVRALFMSFNLFTIRMAVFSTMLAITLLYGSDQITVARVFVISSYFNLLSRTMSQRFVRGVAEIAELRVALRRLQEFLELEEKVTEKNSECESRYTNGYTNGCVNSPSTNKVKAKIQDDLSSENICISIRNATARWAMRKKQESSSKNSKAKKIHGNDLSVVENELAAWEQPALANVSATLSKGKLIGIVGPVGAGKSSLLQAVLHELPLESGSISINGSISYASQDAWIFAGTVRQNILFGEEYNKNRYETVVKTCALVKDFNQLEMGDLTIIGERGASLSGGQRARINLARAVYRCADIYLLDDPLSAVDAHVGCHLFERCIGPKGFLAEATRILVTHQVHFLKDADWIIVFRDGEIELQGSPSVLAKTGIDSIKLIKNDTKSLEDVINENSSRKNSINSSESESSSSPDKDLEIKDTENDESRKTDDKNQVEMELCSKRKINGSVGMNYFKAGAHWPTLVIILTLFLIVQALGSFSDYWVAFWTKQEEMRARTNSQKLKVSDYYPFAANASNSSSNGEPQSFEWSTKNCIYVHGCLMAGLFILAITRAIGFYTVCMRASQKLHTLMFKGLVSTTLGFFNANPSGRILNRFSKDVGSIDENLPKAMLDATQVILHALGTIFVTLTVNPIFSIPIVVMAIIFIFVRRLYLKTSKNIKRLEGMTKSPVFTHLAATLNGLSTVRAYKAEKILREEFDNHQDTHTACYFIFVATSSAFALTLDIMCVIFSFCVIFFFMLFDVGVSGEKVGLAVSQVLSLTGVLQYGIRQSAEVSNEMTAVERVLEYRDLDKEKEPKTPSEVSVDWPEKGRIEFRNVVYRYFGEADAVLKNLSFVIEPMEKIGIVGRTGAGKSSLIGALFRLASVGGEILIDGVDTSSIKLSDLRSRIAVISQNPILFSGTLRRNLDPFNEFTDAEIWNALEDVELKEIAGSPLGLHFVVFSGGSNFSVGQRQLLCLARAILRKNRILILDEATANVDPQTDLLIQKTIREKFAQKNCTVLTVAHRLHTIIDCDRVLVMDAGHATEFDEPYRLLQHENGSFASMIKALGEQESERLLQIARDSHNSKRKIA